MFANQENEFKILNVENKFNSKTQLNQQEYKKYSKILNNLLGINSRGDKAVFTKLNSLNIDITKIISPDKIKYIFSKNSFKIKIEKNKITNSRFSKDNEDVDIFYINKWKRYIKQVNEIYQQTNMWPLFIGTYFLKGKPGDKFIYAPLVLREVELIIEDNEVYLIERNKSVQLNDKLIFLIEEFQGIVIPQLKDEIEKSTFEEVINELNEYLKNSIDFDFFDQYESFKDLRTIDIKNEKIIRTNGVVLLFAHPMGGVLRNAVIDLIKNNKMDEIIKTNIDSFLVSDDESIKNIVYKPQKIARVCPTDPSQENAIISSLKRNTIIIGPPGTGKSQTIANIIANILLENKKALFISQKRVALEVVLERMGLLQYFTLQLVEHRSKTSPNEKINFYKYMKNFFEMVKSVSSHNTNTINTSNIINSLKPLVSYSRLEYWKTKDINNINTEDVELFSNLKLNNSKINHEMTKKIENIFNQLKRMSRFEEIDKLLELNERDLKVFAQKLNVPPKFKFLWIKKYDKNFKNFFNANIELLNCKNKFNLTKNLINSLSKYDRLNYLNELEKIYHHHTEEISKTNLFTSDIKKILSVCSLRANEIYRKIHSTNPKWAQRFNGYIQRSFAQPNKFISIFKNELKKLFNVYVSTPEALSSFIDFKKDRFDYVIFDEASQIFLEKAIPFMAIADKIIIAGDDQQMQPSNWFGNRSDVDEDEKMEENIDSLLTYAIENGLNQEMLELNYRSSSANLTTFSSKEFYKCNLKTLDLNEKLDKSIEIINVNGKWENNQNLIEANKTIEILKQNIDKYERIIVLTLNKQQMELINVKLSIDEPEIYNKIIDGEIILKNLENIQGDEADLVIVSIAYTKEASLSSTYVGRPGGRNALNVAITRAKNKMIIIKSIESKDITTKTEMNNDLRTFKNWIEFLEMNEEEQKTYSLTLDNNNINDIESPFEYEVIEWLKTKSFNKKMKIVCQYPIGSYRIDVALIDELTDQFILGIEIDGFLYHSTIRQKYNDLVRQNFIESKGYKLIRISELLWKTNKEKVYLMIQEKLS